MKQVWAEIKPFKLDDVREALSQLDIHGLTVWDNKGFGRPKGQELYRGAQYVVDFLPTLALVVCVEDEQLEVVIAAICEAARTGKPGDGKIFVIDLEEAVRIRTGETGRQAL